MYGFKECSSCGALYNKDHCCSVDTFVRDPNETPDSSKQSLPNCPKCGDPVDGLVCRPCAFVRKCLNEVCFTSCDENESFKNLLNPPQQTQTHSSESSNDNTNFVDTPQEPIVENQDPGENFAQNSSQSPPQITQNCCYGCGDSLDGFFCQRCTCDSCGNGAHYGYNCPPQVPIISNPEPCYNQNFDEFPQTLPSFQQHYLYCTCKRCGCNQYDGVCFYCTYGKGTPINFSTPYSFNDSPNFSNHPPQNSPNFQQQYLSCENCGGPHETYQCQPMNENYYEPNFCYNSNSFGFDHFQPPQHPVIHQTPLEESMEKLRIAFQAWSDNIRQKKEQEEKRIAEEQVAKARYWKIPICNDDDEDDTIAITPVLPTMEPDNSLSMGDEHLSTIPKTESDELIKSSDENLVPIPSESEDECECDVPDCDDSQTTNFSTFSNPLFDDSTSSDDESSHEEVIHEISFKTYSNPLFDLDEEIISSEFNPIHNEDFNSTLKNDRFDTESYLLESLLNRDTLMASSPKIDSLFDEFAGELITIPPRIIDSSFYTQ
ncbi:hypothetical protein Tco_0938627 [Tanacetum coccineum]|uniref:CCHC-type domain-containing protein n=1 Tax=Tanacetum coccineum TaxID=301880 RepID=A0ABQ5DK99_9ASTR